jgi:hypothetical protein
MQQELNRFLASYFGTLQGISSTGKTKGAGFYQ